MFQFSLHCLEQLEIRNISQETIRGVLAASSSEEKTIIEGVTIYQGSIVENGKLYLIRVFVNENKTPPLIITAYKTSKINKY